MSVSYAITLVHGTFAHSAEWTKEGSNLRKIIEEEAGARTKFYSFSWSGANTRRARLEAGRSLSLHLREVRDLLPRARHIIIAHSHGGNIAIYARKLAGIEDVSIVTLNTPFIQVTPREVIPLIDTILKELAVGFGTALMVAVFWSCVIGIIDDYQAFVIIACILGSRWYLRSKCKSQWIADKILPDFYERQNMLISNLSTACVASQRLLAIRTVGDEVETFLSIVDYLGELPVRSVGGFCGCLERIRAVRETVRTLLSVPLELEPFGVGEAIKKLLNILLLILTFGPTVVLLLLAPLYIFVTVRMAAYWDWDDSVASYALVHVHTSAKPEIAWTANEAKAFRFGSPLWPFRKEYVVPRSLIGAVVAGKLKQSLRHSLIYDDEAAIRDIMRWSFAGEIPQGSLPFFPPEV